MATRAVTNSGIQPILLQPKLKSAEDARKTGFVHFKDWAGSGQGIHRILDVLQKICKVAYAVLEKTGHDIKHYFKKAATGLGQAIAVLVLPRLPEVIQDAVQSAKSLREANRYPGEFARKVVKVVKDGSEATASTLYTASWVTSFTNTLSHTSKALASVAQVPAFVNDVAETVQLGDNYHSCKRAHDQVDKQSIQLPPVLGVDRDRSAEIDQIRTNLKANLVFSQRAHLIKLVKVVVSVALGGLGLAGMFFAIPALPAIALATTALVGSLFAVAAHFYKVSNPNFKVVEVSDLFAHAKFARA